ncbi:MAG: hypothetical protein ACE5GW_05190 [Planctomycetota bacterium]
MALFRGSFYRVAGLLVALALLSAADSALAQPASLRLHTDTPVVMQGESFALEVFLDNPGGLALGGYQGAVGFDAERFEVLTVAGPAESPGAIAADVFEFSAPPPAGDPANPFGCAAWLDGSGQDAVSAVALLDIDPGGAYPGGYTGAGGLLFRVTFQALPAAPPAGPDAFVHMPPNLDCVWLGSIVVDPQGNLVPTAAVGTTVGISDVATPLSLFCSSSPGIAGLDWENGDLYEEIRIYRDLDLIAELPGSTTSYSDATGMPLESYSYHVVGVTGGIESPHAICDVTIASDTPSPEALLCTTAPPTIALAWTNPIAYDLLQVRRDGILIASLAGGADAYTDMNPPTGGSVQYEVSGTLNDTESVPATCSADLTVPEEIFIRGDANVSGDTNLADAVTILTYLFSAGQLDCLDAADVNDSADIDLADPVALLTFLFASGAAPPLPYPDPGPDPTPDPLGCATPPPAP